MDHLIFLNQVAQGIYSLEDAIERLEGKNDQERFSLFVQFAMMIGQAHPLPADVGAAIELAQLKPTFTPCVMLSKKPLNEALGKFRSLPRQEDKKSFRLMLALFQIADKRRRESCGDDCNHWWHQDLSDKKILASIVRPS